MHEMPDTRDSLMLQIRDSANGAAWDEFVSIYRPLIYRFARGKGLQDADAQDLVQRVLVSVSCQVANWNEEGGNGRFRAWLLRVARNAIIDAIRRKRPDSACGGTSLLQQLARQVDGCSELEDMIEREHAREVFRWAARQVRTEVEPNTWDAFWLTTIDGKDVADVAKHLSRSIGSVYTARSRVMRSLQRKVLDYEQKVSGNQHGIGEIS